MTEASFVPGLRTGELPPFHRLSPLTFQDLCRDLFDAEPGTAFCNVYGKNGQSQYGIDLLAYRKGGNGVEVGQCKCYQQFSHTKIREASNEFFKFWESHWSHEEVGRFILFVASDLSERKNQEEILRQRRRFGEIKVEYEVWDAAKLRNKLRPQPGVVATYLDPPDYWLGVICGQMRLTWTPQGQMPALSVVAGQLERVAAALSGDALREVEALRGVWREGRGKEVRQRIASFKSDRDRWAILSPESKARILRLEASLVLSTTGNLSRAEQLAEMAHNLAPDSGDLRLKTIIAARQGKLDEAIHGLDGLTDPDSVHLRAALLLDRGRYDEAALVLETSRVASEPSAETYRLRGLLRLALRDVAGAQLQIQKALELAPRWQSVRFAAAVIDYFSALSPAVLPDALPSWPWPVEWDFVKTDDDTQANLRRAATFFQQLHQEEREGGDLEAQFHIWHLASLATSSGSQEAAQEYCNALLKHDPGNYPGIVWGLARAYSFPIKECRTWLERRLSAHQASVSDVLALTACYLGAGEPKRSLQLLKRTEHLFEQGQAHALWLQQKAQLSAYTQDSELATSRPETGVDDHNKDALKAETLWQLARRSGDWQPLSDYLEALYEQTDSPFWLYEFCVVAMRQQRWNDIADKASLLTKKIGTGAALRLAATACYNARRYRLCLALLTDNAAMFPGKKLPSDLRRLRVGTEQALGIISQALDEAAELVAEDPSSDNLITLADACLVHGDFARLRTAARRVTNRRDLSAAVLLRIAELVWLEDKTLAADIWRQAVALELTDEVFGAAIALGFQLGCESELRSLTARLPELAARGAGGIRALSIQELLSFGQQWRSQAEELATQYRDGRLPIHLLLEYTNGLMVHTYHTQLMNNERVSNPYHASSLMVRYGGRPTGCTFAESAKKWRLHLDLTALLLAAHFDILDSVEQGFAPLYIPSAVQMALLEMRAKLAPHQPSLLAAHRLIAELTAHGDIRIVEPEILTAQTVPGPRTSEECDWRDLLAKAREASGYMLTFLPLRDKTPDLNPLQLQEEQQQHMVNLRAVIDALHAQGELSDSDYQKGLVRMGTEGEKSPQYPIPSLGSDLFCHANVLDVLAEAGILPVACRCFRVHVERREINRINAELRYYDRMFEVLDWLGQLSERLAQGIADHVYMVMPVMAASPSVDEQDFPRTAELACLRDLLLFEPHDDDVIWADDRFLNKHLSRDRVPIIGINEVLRALVGSGELTQDQHYSLLARMRAANLRFVPIEADEILYHLGRAKLVEGHVAETQPLAVMRRYVAACLLQADALQKPSLEAPLDRNTGEIQFVLGLNHALEESLRRLWANEEAGEAERAARADWLLDGIYLDYLGLLTVISWRKSAHESYYMSGLSLAGLISNGFALASDGANGRTVRRAYLTWLNDRLLARRLVADHNLVTATAATLKQLLLNVRQEVPERVPEAVITLFLQQFYEDVPEPIHHELASDPEFMNALGVQMAKGISVLDLAFEPSSFYGAAEEAMNGREGAARLLDAGTTVSFGPPRSGAHQGQLILVHPFTHQEVTVSDERLALLSESPSQRESTLRRNRYWFDCTKGEFETAVTRIVTAPNPVSRVEEADRWRQASAAKYYTDLFTKVKQREALRYEDLLPPSADGLWRYHRLPPDIGRPLPETVETGIQDLIETEGLYTAFVRTAGLPLPLPEPIIHAALALSEEVWRKVIHRLLSTASSPMARFHFAYLLLRMQHRSPVLGRLAGWVVASLLNEDYRIEMEAYLALLRWVGDEFDRWEDLQSVPFPTRLALTWSHTHQLYSIFQATGMTADWVMDTFGQLRPFPAAAFTRKPAEWHEISHPSRVKERVFLVSGISYILGAQPSYRIDDCLEPRLERVIFVQHGETRTPALELLVDSSLASDSLGSFLSIDRSHGLRSLLADSEAGLLDHSVRWGIVASSLDRLTKFPEDPTAWTQIMIVTGSWPVHEDLRPLFERVMRLTDYAALFAQDEAAGMLALHLAANQAVCYGTNELLLHLETQLLRLVAILEQRTRGQQIAKSGLPSGPESTYAQLPFLFEIALTIARACPSPEQIAEKLADLIRQMIDNWPAIGPALRPALSNLCAGLPVELSTRIWPALVRARAE